MEQLKGQFLQGKPQKLKKSKGNNTAKVSNTLPSSSLFKLNGRIAPKRGAE